MNKKLIAASTATAGLIAALALAAPMTATAKESTSPSTSIPGGGLKAYAYIQDWADASNCGQFSTRASTTTPVATLTNGVEWDAVGIGASASIKGVGVSVSGDNSASPSAQISGSNTTSAGVTGTACMSWSTVYLGVFSSATTQVNNTLYTATAHL